MILLSVQLYYSFVIFLGLLDKEDDVYLFLDLLKINVNVVDVADIYAVVCNILVWWVTVHFFFFIPARNECCHEMNVVH